jgi:GTP:adenosylcobinamide-phosphate guanylyltransferase
MAAGEGMRLRPLTERWPKPILPIGGRAVIAALLRQFEDEGFGPVTVVTGHLAEEFERLLEGEEVRFVRQPEPLGSADAVRRALTADGDLPAIVTAADTLFRRGDLIRFQEAFTSAAGAGAIAYVRRRGAAAIRVEGGLVQRVVGPEPGELAPAPLWGLSEGIDLEELPGPPYELAAAFQRAIDAGKPVAAIEIGLTRQLTEPADLVRENFPYLETYERERDV